MMIQSTTVLGFDGYRNASKEGGAMKQTILECEPNQVVIHINNPSHGRRWARCTPEQLCDTIQTNHYVYEVLHKFPLKVYFDVDQYGTIGTLEEYKALIQEYFPNAQMAISGSITETKISYHIVLTNYVMQTIEDMQVVKSIVQDMYERNSSFDKAVYHLNRNMKCVNQSKTDGRIQEIIEDVDISHHLITSFHTIDAMSIDTLPMDIITKSMVIRSTEVFNLGSLPKCTMPLPKDVDISNITPIEILQLLPNTPDCVFDYRHLVARYCHTYSVSMSEFLQWVVHRSEDDTGDIDRRVIKWTAHWNNLSKFPPVAFERILYVLRYFYPTIGKDFNLLSFQNTFNLPNEHICKVDTLTPDAFHYPSQAILLNTGMGSGKTTQTIQYLNNSCPSFLWITSNIALASGTLTRFQQCGIKDISYYKTFTKKTKPQMNTVAKLIICLNSLHYVDKCNTPYVVIDEIETLLNKFEGSFIKNKSQIWNIFIRLLTRASKIILLDAFITTKTITLLKSLGISYTIVERIIEPSTRTIEYMTAPKQMLNDLINKVDEGHKTFIYYPFKTDSKETATHKHMSVDTLVRIIQSRTGKKGIGYHSDADDKIKKTLKDVNDTWDKYDFVVSNNVITCGVSYENTDYSYIYMFIASFNLPRDMVQFSYRIRNLSANKIHVCFIPSYNPSVWESDCGAMNDPIYTRLYKNIITEYKAPAQDTFKFLCVKAKYIQCMNTEVLDKSLNAQMTKLINTHLLAIKWEDIPSVDFYQAETLRELCTTANASLKDKYMLTKYYFRKQFIDPDTNDDMLAELWDSRCSFFLQKMKRVLSNPTNIFKKLQIYNRLEELFPTTVDDLKTTADINELIFQKFTFRSTNKHSCSKKVLKDIYNTYFGQRIITAIYNKDTKNTKYNINPIYNEYYAFCLEQLRINYTDMEAMDDADTPHDDKEYEDADDL